jgi:hypothetical protein
MSSESSEAFHDIASFFEFNKAVTRVPPAESPNRVTAETSSYFLSRQAPKATPSSSKSKAVIGHYANFRTQSSPTPSERNNSIEDWIPDSSQRQRHRLRPSRTAREALRQYRDEMASTKDQKKGMDILYLQLFGG